MAEIWELDVLAQAAAIRDGEIGPAEAVEAAIARAEALNPKLNAIILPLYEQARDSAATGDRDAPFAGVPFLLKDLMAELKGTRMAEGSRFLADSPPATEDSELTARYKRAGLNIIGKTNTPEFGLVPTTEPLLFGPTRNPWNLGRTPGGSSGGSAAAVAAGIVPAAHANDGGGSIRIPAACCGLFGLKPSRGRMPMGPHYGDIGGGIAIEHVVSRSVRDSAALLDATAGPDIGDPYQAPAPERAFLDEVGAPPGRLRVGFSRTAPDGATLDPQALAAVEDAATLLADLGHDAEEAQPSFDVTVQQKGFTTLWFGFLGWAIADWRRRYGVTPSEDNLEPLTWEIYRRSRDISAADYLLAVQDCQRMTRDVSRFFVDRDLWLTPTTTAPPLLLGEMVGTKDQPMAGARRGAKFASFTAICNITGQPAMSVPLYWTPDGLPVGAHLAARYGAEAILLRLAAQLEEARPWADRRPPLG
ncbi:MAG: amidase [Alphaproteobacteria bacterium]